MEARCRWTGGLSFEALNRQHKVLMDAKAPLGKDQAPTPKELLLNAICGCSAMDVISILKKSKQEPESFSVFARTDLTPGHPSIFQSVHIQFHLEGNLAAASVMDAVKKSMSLYCGVSAMLVKTVPISFDVYLGKDRIGGGEAQF